VPDRVTGRRDPDGVGVAVATLDTVPRVGTPFAIHSVKADDDVRRMKEYD